MNNMQRAMARVDAATAEISRVQVWQWRHDNAKLSDGRQVTPELISATISAQLEHIKTLVGPDRYEHGNFAQASELFERLVLEDPCKDFLTVEAYRYL
jgi:malate synthase